MEPPQGKNFSYYALVRGGTIGIYCYYSSLMAALAPDQKVRPIYKGFYSFQEAMDYMMNYWDLADSIYVEYEPREGPTTEQLEAELRQAYEDIEKFTDEIIALREEVQEKLKEAQELQDQLAQMKGPQKEQPMDLEERRNPRTRK